MRIAVPKESRDTRVAATPETVTKMVKAGLAVSVEAGAGLSSQIEDADFIKAGAVIVPDAVALFAEADVLLKVQPPARHALTGLHESEMTRPGAIWISLLWPLSNIEDMKQLAARRISAFALDLMPRITRAQRMDVLSAMSSLAGYKAVLVAASAFGRFVPMMTTAAGTLPPARVLILGAGVAGLQAIATAKRLGAIVEVFDTRPAVKEQVESLGAEFIALNLEQAAAEDRGGYAKSLSEHHLTQERALIAERARNADIVITTALVPGKAAPVLITKDAVAGMKKGSVIVDLAVEQGGNCELTQVGQTTACGITLIGAVNLPATLPVHASQMYARNVLAFLLHLGVDKSAPLNLSDEIVQGTLVTHQGEIVHAGVKAAVVS